MKLPAIAAKVPFIVVRHTNTALTMNENIGFEYPRQLLEILEQQSEHLRPRCFQSISSLYLVQMLVSKIVQTLSYMGLIENLHKGRILCPHRSRALITAK